MLPLTEREGIAKGEREERRQIRARCRARPVPLVTVDALASPGDGRWRQRPRVEDRGDRCTAGSVAIP